MVDGDEFAVRPLGVPPMLVVPSRKWLNGAELRLCEWGSHRKDKDAQHNGSKQLLLYGHIHVYRPPKSPY